MQLLLLLKPLLLNKFTLGAIALTLTLLAGYNWAYSRGKASQAPIIAALKADKQELERTVEAKRLLAIAQEEAYERSLAQAKEANRATLAILRVDLDRSQVEVRKLKEKLSVKVTEYVTPKADASCAITGGFIRLHNLAASADPSSAPQSPDLARSGPEDVDAPTTLKISTLGATVADNYTECKARLDTINAWQLWYRATKDSFDRAVIEQTRLQPATSP